MGCGQSKINLYPRRNKNGGKGNSAKKSGAAVDKEADEEEGGTATAGAPPEDPEEDPEHGKQLLPLSAHPTTIEVSESQQDFFKMLDERIDGGKDYDSTSETEVRIEHERRKFLIDQWRSASQSSFAQSSPPTPARRRMPRPQPPDRHSSPGATRRCYRQHHVAEGVSPPPRRAQSAHHHHSDPRQVNGDTWMREDSNSNKSPVKRPQSTGANWKNNPKVAPYNQKPKKNEVNENQRSSNYKEFEHISNSSQDVSQITYNPTFQTHSPAHATKSQQPYITQIVSYPVSQQVTPPSTPKFIAPPEEYQDPQNNVPDNKYASAARPAGNSPGTPSSQSHIYYIHGNVATDLPQDIHQQRQQTAIHLQQYVAMKQAQQQMFTFIQRSPHSVFPNPAAAEQPVQHRVYEQVEEYAQYGHTAARPHSAPAPVGIVRPMPAGAPGGFTAGTLEGAHMTQMPVWTPMPAVVSSMGPWVPGQDMPYYPQAHYTHQMYRANSAGSAGTMTRYHKEKQLDDGTKTNMCQSINLVRQKPVGQIVPSGGGGGPELAVWTSASDSPSPASLSTDSGVSPGSGVLSNSKCSVVHTPPGASVKDTSVVIAIDTKKKNKSVPFPRSLKTSKSLDSS